METMNRDFCKHNKIGSTILQFVDTYLDKNSDGVYEHKRSYVIEDQESVHLYSYCRDCEKDLTEFDIDVENIVTTEPSAIVSSASLFNSILQDVSTWNDEQFQDYLTRTIPKFLNPTNRHKFIQGLRLVLDKLDFQNSVGD